MPQRGSPRAQRFKGASVKPFKGFTCSMAATFDSGSSASEFAPDQAPTYTLVADDYFCQPEMPHDSFEDRGTREDYVGAPGLDTRQLLSLFERHRAQKRDCAQDLRL